MPIDLIHSEKFRNLIDWNIISSRLSQNANFEKNKSYFTKPIFHTTTQQVINDFNKLESTIDSLDTISGIFNSNLDSIKSIGDNNFIFSSLTKEYIYSFEDLAAFALFFEINEAFYNTNLTDTFSLHSFQSLIIQIRKLVNYDSTINYSGFSDISKQYNKVDSLNSRLRSTINSILKNEKYAKSLQYDEFDYLDDLFLIPIKSNSYSPKLGKIIHHSKTGSTLYVEPFEIKELNQEKIYEDAKLNDLIIQKCREISTNLHKNVFTINESLESLFMIDMFYAKAKFCFDHNLRRPHFNTTKKLKFINLSHPLIKSPVLNSVELNNNQNLVISGPNTGGKTVLLKAICLNLFLARLGIFTSADEADIFIYDKIYFFGNDQQDISSGLSSFASECSNYLSCLGDSSKDSIVFIDEIFNSTSSEEASALANSLLQRLVTSNGSKVMVSTHHFQLKSLLHEGENFISAHMGFDTNNFEPTYKFYLGTPGSSHALDIFKKISNDPSIFEEAKLFLSKNIIELENKLAKIEEKEIELDKLIIENNIKQNELKSQSSAFHLNMEAEKKEIINIYKTKINKLLDKASHLKKSSSNLSKTELNKSVDSIKAELKTLDHHNTEDKSNFNLIPLIDFKIGDSAYSLTLGTLVTIIDIKFDKKKALVGQSVFKSWVSFDDLFISKTQKSSKQSSLILTSTTINPIDNDLRGLSISECETKLEKIINDLYSGDLPYVNLIHGHGTGALKNAVRERFSKEIDFIWEPQEGNDGVTVVKLKP